MIPNDCILKTPTHQKSEVKILGISTNNLVEIDRCLQLHNCQPSSIGYLSMYPEIQ